MATKTLGVLQEQGVYAMVVFLLSRSGNKNFDDKDLKDENRAAIEIMKNLGNSLSQDPLNNLQVGFQSPLDYNLNFMKKEIMENFLSKISENLEKLLFVKEFYEQTLIYVRHIAKGMKNE